RRSGLLRERQACVRHQRIGGRTESGLPGAGAALSHPRIVVRADCGDRNAAPDKRRRIYVIRASLDGAARQARDASKTAKRGPLRQVETEGPLWGRTDKTQGEHNESGVHLINDIGTDIGLRREGPIGDMTATIFAWPAASQLRERSR